ncbi:ROK family protein [Streptomyces sp. NPDC051976]|uniref:ROK family protein n=1 Tax=Streptomyces sp. NPDC051976 TaxID=3154947 RepID=UPI00343D5ADE
MRDARVIAVDVGGADIKAGLLEDASAHVGGWIRRPTGQAAGPERVIASIVELVAELQARAEREGAPAAAVGLAVPGIVDEEAGVGIYSATIGWRDVAFQALIEERTGLPTAVCHDVRAGGTAEARLGAGRGRGDFLFVPVGAGIGAAVMTKGHARTGATHRAGEIGHLVVRPDGERCACGAHGCAEAYASAPAIARRYLAATGRSAEPAEVARRAAADDMAAGAVWDDAVEALADALLATVSVLDPSLIVLGGGLARSGGQLLFPLENAMISRAGVQAIPPLAPAVLGDRAGCVGAGLAAMDLAARLRTSRRRVTVFAR